MDPIEVPPTSGEEEITSQIIAGFKKYIQSISSTNPANVTDAAGPQGVVTGAPSITPIIPGSQSHAVFGTYDSLF